MNKLAAMNHAQLVGDQVLCHFRFSSAHPGTVYSTTIYIRKLILPTQYYIHKYDVVTLRCSSWSRHNLYLIKKLRMAQDQFAWELQKDVQNERLLLKNSNLNKGGSNCMEGMGG